MNVGTKVRVTAYPDESVIGCLGIITRVPENDEDYGYYDVELFVGPNPDRPHDTSFLCYEDEIEVTS